MKRLRPHTHARAGFTIVEVIVAMGLFVLGMASILGLLSFGAALSRTAALRNSAAAAAEAVIADLEENLFPLETDPATGEPVVGEPVDFENRIVPGHDGILYTAHAVPAPAETQSEHGPQRWRVDVEIAWTSGGRRRTKQFSTLLLQEIPFGERLRRQFIEAPRDEAAAAPPAKKNENKKKP